jgi:TM2 domain-containing membrane protein YozV
MSPATKDPTLAAVLSLLIPGVGQLYLRRWVWGIIWLVITPGLWLGSGGTLGWICHILSALQANSQAKKV